MTSNDCRIQDLVFSSGVIQSYYYNVLWERYEDYLRELISSVDARMICDIGGGRNPGIHEDFIRKGSIQYSLLDISKAELDAAPAGYNKIQADIGDPQADLPEASFDLCFSRMVAEHIQDGEAFHRNVYRLLKPGGVAIHFFPTLFTLPYVANVMMPEWLSQRMLMLFNPRDLVQHGKFPAYYSKCYGPIASQLSFLESLDYEPIHYFAGFGHDYYRRIPLIREMAAVWSRLCCRRNWYYQSSFAVVVLRRKAVQSAQHELPVL